MYGLYDWVDLIFKFVLVFGGLVWIGFLYWLCWLVGMFAILLEFAYCVDLVWILLFPILLCCTCWFRACYSSWFGWLLFVELLLWVVCLIGWCCVCFWLFFCCLDCLLAYFVWVFVCLFLLLCLFVNFLWCWF